MNEDALHTFRRLQQLARERGRTTQQVLELYAHERLVARIGASRWRSALILKGGMLLATLHLRDVTRDVDLLVLGIDAGDEAAVRALVTEIARMDLRDGVSFDSTGITIDRIRDEADYPGLRIRLTAHIHSARVRVRIDLNVGDPVDGISHAFDPMLEGDPVEVFAYPLEAVLAEKLATMMILGTANTRERDFADVWLIAHQFNLDGDRLATLIEATTRSRGHASTFLSMVLDGIGNARQAAWERFVARTGLTHLPVDYTTVATFVARFADPVVAGLQPGTTWDRHRHEWS